MLGGGRSIPLVHPLILASRGFNFVRAVEGAFSSPPLKKYAWSSEARSLTDFSIFEKKQKQTNNILIRLISNLGNSQKKKTI